MNLRYSVVINPLFSHLLRRYLTLELMLFAFLPPTVERISINKVLRRILTTGLALAINKILYTRSVAHILAAASRDLHLDVVGRLST